MLRAHKLQLSKPAGLMRNHQYPEQLDTHCMVLERHADIERGDTMIDTIENQKKLLADTSEYQVLPDSNAGKLLVFRTHCAWMPAGASQCQIWPTPTRSWRAVCWRCRRSPG
jgi:hypothetical protein